MSAFDDNPFAEDDDEMAPHVEAPARKRGREEDVMGEPAPTLSSEQKATSPPPATATTATPVPESFSFEGGGDALAADVPSTDSLLAEYDAGHEEDEFNALVVRAARLESELKQQEKAHSDELDRLLKDNGNLKESMDRLRAMIIQERAERDSVLRAPNLTHTDSGDSLAVAALVEVLLQKISFFEREDTELLKRLAVWDSEGVIDAALLDHVRSCITGKLDELPDLAALDSQTERCRLETSEAAIAKLRTDGVVHVALPLVEALMAELRQLVGRYDAMYADTKALRDLVACKASLLGELAQESLDWYSQFARRALLSDGRDVLPLASVVAQEGVLGNQQMEKTLHHMESVIHQLLLQTPNIVSASNQGAPSVAAASALALCRELESHTEVLGREVLRLRKLLATDTTTLQQLGYLKDDPEVTLAETRPGATAKETEWLVTLAKSLTERLVSVEALGHSLKMFDKKRSAPAVELQLAFYRRYVEMQETLLQALYVLNRALQDRAHLVSVVRQVVLHDGDDETVSMFAERIIQDSENDISGLSEKLEHMCVDTLRQFSEEVSDLLCQEDASVKQSTHQLREVRSFFANVVQALDQLVYGTASNLGPICESFEETPLAAAGEALEDFSQLGFAPCNDAGQAILQMVSGDHDRELQEEVCSVQRRNAELMKCMKWLLMQRSHGVISRLRTVLKEIDALKQKMSALAEREAKWTTLNDDVATVRREVAAAQSATAAMKNKLNDLRERVRAKREFGV